MNRTIPALSVLAALALSASAQAGVWEDPDFPTPDSDPWAELDIVDVDLLNIAQYDTLLDCLDVQQPRLCMFLAIHYFGVLDGNDNLGGYWELPESVTKNLMQGLYAQEPDTILFSNDTFRLELEGVRLNSSAPLVQANFNVEVKSDDGECVETTALPISAVVTDGRLTLVAWATVGTTSEDCE